MDRQMEVGDDEVSFFFSNPTTDLSLKKINTCGFITENIKA